MTEERLPKICLKNVICRHHAIIPDKSKSSIRIVHVIIFYDPRDHETYLYIAGAADEHNFKEGKEYSITARVGGGVNLSHVQIINPSEQLDESGNLIKQNALDILLPDTNLTFDEKHDILAQERREK